MIKYIYGAIFVCLCAVIFEQYFIIPNAYHISGSWRSSAKNIWFNKNILCAELRTNDYTNDYTSIIYKKSCIDIPNEENMEVFLENRDGVFVIVNTQNYNDKASYYIAKYESIYNKLIKSFKINSKPKGNWIDTAKDIQYFYDGVVCASLKIKKTLNWLSDSDYYNESCIVNDENSYYINDNGKFKKMTHSEYVKHSY